MTSTFAPWLSLVLGAFILLLKLLAYQLTGSVALLSDALESVVNVVAALAALLAVRAAARPPDARHPFGHSKIEYLSAVLEGVMIVLAALLIVQQAWGAFTKPTLVEGLGLGLPLALVAAVLNGLLAHYLLRVGRRERSPALIADGQHLWTDVVTSVAVVVGVSSAQLTGWWMLDPLLALIVAGNILRMGGHLLRDSIGGLLDESLPDKDVDRIQNVIKGAMQGALEVHDLRTRKAGRLTFITFHLIVPSAMSVAEAHEICDRLEQVIQRAFKGSMVTVHVEPDHKAKHEGYVVVRSRSEES